MPDGNGTTELKALNQMLANQVRDLTEKVECLVESNKSLVTADDRHRHNIAVLRVIAVVMAGVLICLGFLFYRAQDNYNRSKSALSIAEQTNRSREIACQLNNQRDEVTRQLLSSILTQAYSGPSGQDAPGGEDARELRRFLNQIAKAYTPRDCAAAGTGE